jgi:serine/threonine-protein kinase
LGPASTIRGEARLSGVWVFCVAEAGRSTGDIYGIGCLTYWLLTGQLVFTANTAMQLLIQHAQATAEPPSARTELPIPKELDAIVLVCLAKNPSDRPQTAHELARRLEAVPVRDEWTPELARAWWETHQPMRS